MIRSQSPRKILVPCDGSKPSANALVRATELFMPAGDGANINQTEIILLYTVPYIEVPLPLDESEMVVAESAQIKYIQQMYSYLKDRAFEMLQELADKFVNKDRFTVRIEILYGSPVEKIIEFAHREKVDAIVIGNIGLSGFSKLKVLGSVSRSVSERAGVPVMIVPYSNYQDS
jgi:nucleotide-binding universal stress UspA family protein